MAKYRFADQVENELKASGVTITPNGTTVIAPPETPVDNPVDKPVDNTVITPSQTVNTTTPPPSSTPQGATDTPPAQHTPSSDTRVIEMQREEIARLRGEVEKYKLGGSQQQPSSREQQLEQELNEAKEKIAKMSKSERADALKELMERQTFDLVNVDDEAALEIKKALIDPVLGVVEDLRKENESLRESLRGKQLTPEQEAQERKVQTYNSIIKEIPDFDTIIASSEFRRFAEEPDPTGLFDTKGDALQASYDRGNGKYVIQELKKFLGGETPQTLAQIADVGGVKGVGTQSPSSQPEQNDDAIYDNYDYDQKMLRDFQSRNISRAEYKEFKAKRDEYRKNKYGANAR